MLARGLEGLVRNAGVHACAVIMSSEPLIDAIPLWKRPQDGAVINPDAATPALLSHRGPAVVFDSIEDFHARIDDPGLDVTPDSVLVLRGCGP